MNFIEHARTVFSEFQRGFSEYPSARWSLQFTPAVLERMGLTRQEAEAGLAVLKQKGLVERRDRVRWVLTQDGTEGCLHPESLDQFLGPRAPATGTQSVTIGSITGNTQIGHGNQQKITYEVMLTQLVDALEKSDLPTAEKGKLLDAARSLLAHPFTQTAVTVGATIATTLAGR